MATDPKKDILKLAVNKVVMYDAGTKPEKYKPMPMPSSPAKYYPCVYVDSKHAPCLKGCEVGEELTLVVKAKIVGHDASESGNHSSDNYRLEIREMGTVESKKK